MRVVHRISLRPSHEDRRFLAAHGFFVGDGHVSFDIGEDHEHWPAIREFIAKRPVGDIAETRFSRPELAAAAWHEIGPSWHWGYPQPEDDFEYLRATYDLSDYCAECGIGAVQNAPFQLKGEPRWGTREILQLNWVFDEYFVRPDVWEQALRPLGIGSRQVLDRRGRELTTVVQILSGDDETIVDLADYPRSRCPACNRIKYLPIKIGRFPPITSRPRLPWVRTAASFGSGASAFKAVLASADVYRALMRMGAKGVVYRPEEQR